MGEPEHPHAYRASAACADGVRRSFASLRAEPAEFDMDVGTGSELADLRAPFSKDLVALAGIRAKTNRPADMVEHDRRLRKGARQINQLAELGVVHPRAKAEAERRQPGEALAHLGHD
jgi:hypothetical protein